MQTNIHQLVKDTERRYMDNVNLGKYVSYNLYETAQQVQAYLHSTHLSGKTDSQGYEKPWDDIVIEAVNARTRATDLNVSNIRFITPSAKYVTANTIFNVAMLEWFQNNKFGLFLDKWGRELAEYNSRIVKIVERNDELYIDTVSWNNMIVDPINIKYGPIIEKMYLTEVELRERYTVKDGDVEDLITTRRKLLDNGEISANDGEYYELYEVHTEAWEDGKEVYKMYVVSFLSNKAGEERYFTLYEGKEDKCPYVLTHLTPSKDRTMGIGVVEQLIPKQWLVNHYTHITKKILDFSTKVGLQTSDKSFIGMNSLDFDTGDILITEDNKPLQPINNQSHDIIQVQNVKAEQKASSRSISGVSEAMSGEVKAGAAWRQTNALLQESKDLFNKMKEHKSLYLEIILKDFVIPHVLKKLSTKTEITAILDAQGIEKIDRMFISSEAVRRANEKVAKKFLESADAETLDEMQPMQQPDVATETQSLKDELSAQGNQRFFKPSDIDGESWAEYFKDFSTKVVIDITGESINTADNVASLNTLLATMLGSGIPFTHPNVKIVLGEIMRQTSGISPIQLSDFEAPEQPAQPVKAGVINKLTTQPTGQS